MRKRFSLGSKTVEVSFVGANSSSNNAGVSKTAALGEESEDIKCCCGWSGAIDGLEQQVHPRRVDLKCPDCDLTLAEVVYTTLGRDGADARLSWPLDEAELEDSAQTHVSSSSAPQYLQ